MGIQRSSRSGRARRISPGRAATSRDAALTIRIAARRRVRREAGPQHAVGAGLAVQAGAPLCRGPEAASEQPNPIRMLSTIPRPPFSWVGGPPGRQAHARGFYLTPLQPWAHSVQLELCPRVSAMKQNVCWALRRFWGHGAQRKGSCWYSVPKRLIPQQRSEGKTGGRHSLFTSPP